MYFFYFYIVSILLFGAFTIGPFSIRVYMTVIMLLYLLIVSSKKKYLNTTPIPKGFLKGYLLFIIFSALALILNGEYDEYDFNKWLLANFLNCFVSFYAVDYFIKDTNKLHSFMYVLIGLIVSNAIVTLLQFIGNPIGNLIAIAFTTSSEVRSSIADGGALVTFGAGLPRGLFGHVFTNGTLLATLGILCLFPIENKQRIKSFIFLFLLLFCLYASFVTQERAAFVVFLLMALILFFTGPSSKLLRRGVAVTIIFLIITVLPTLIFSDKLGRLAISDSYGEDPRVEIWSYCFSFLKENLILGGPVSYYKRTEVAPHNFFLLVFIHYGLLGGLIISYLYVIMVIQAIKKILNRYSYETTVLAVSVCIYSALSLFHNASIATGDTIIFIIYPLMLKSFIIDKRKMGAS